jgi:ABC-type sugar transport system ATPase subunit
MPRSVAGEILRDGQPTHFDCQAAAHTGIFAVYQTINLISVHRMAGTARCIARQHIF